MPKPAKSSTSKLVNLPSFSRAVLMATSRIPRGRVATYAEVARAIGRPSAVRAVGQALRANPHPLIIPCHRVVRSDGGIGHYTGGGASKKQRLLTSEGVRIIRGFVDLEHYGFHF